MEQDLQEILEIKDFETMVNDTLDTIISSNVGITNTSIGTVVRSLVESILDNVDMSNYYIQYVYNTLGIDNAIGDDLDRIVALFGVERESATPAETVITFSTGDGPYESDIDIPYNTSISTKQASDGTVHAFIVIDENCVLECGQTSIDVHVRCIDDGYLYLPQNTVVELDDTIIGINSVTNTTAVDGGTDEEDDISLRKRSKEFISSFGKCTDNAIKSSVESIDGVMSCTVKDEYDGVGTFGAIVATDVYPPSDELKGQISNMIKDNKASGIKFRVIYPTISYIQISVMITGITSDSYKDIGEAIVKYANSLSVGQTFVVKQMERKILNVLDTDDYDNDIIDITTVLPTTNIEADNESIIRVNKVTINGVIVNG